MTVPTPAQDVTPISESQKRPTAPGSRQLLFRRVLRTRAGLRNGMLLAEVLGPPVGLRDL